MLVRRPFTRQQRTTIIHGMLAFVLMLVVLQLWLLTATMNALFVPRVFLYVALAAWTVAMIGLIRQLLARAPAA